ncbi:hypothetical protein SteCoe_1744 [Stentor coeruleus]|uniref:PHD-type domain-containing protein n=1 Tax=Stentor coeruleus TaxID=5963 RepID=A0A1R2D197_9CILI|nr:hypothetical protein SteCoe_1744 [Stentor coeruleus]
MPNRLKKLREVQDRKKCSICMEYINKKQGLLECGHNDFCLKCISNWANVSNKCPLCKQKFFYIENTINNQIILIDDHESSEEEELDLFENTICEICKMPNDDDSMLLCDNCDKGFHTFCIGLERIPYLEYWFCSQCIICQSEYLQEMQRQEIILAEPPDLPHKRMRRSFTSSDSG